MGINEDQERAFRKSLMDASDSLSRSTNPEILRKATQFERAAIRGSRGDVERAMRAYDKLDLSSVNTTKGRHGDADYVVIKGGTGCVNVLIGAALAGGIAAAGIGFGISRANASEVQPQQPVKPTTSEVRPNILPQSGILFEIPTSSKANVQPAPRISPKVTVQRAR